MTSEHDGRRLVQVHACWSDAEADIIIGFLASNEIEAVSSSKIDHSVYPIIADGLGEIKVWVNEADAGRAVVLLAEQRNADPAENAGTEEEQA